MTTEALPVEFSPFLTVTLDGLHLMIQDGADEGSDPEGVMLAAKIVLKPNVPSGTLILFGNRGYMIDESSWFVSPTSYLLPEASPHASLRQATWPFSEKIINLSDPQIATDSDSYNVSINVYDVRSGDPVELGALTGALICPETPSGAIPLLSTITLAASSPTSAVVRGVSVVSSSFVDGDLVFAMSDGTTQSAGPLPDPSFLGRYVGINAQTGTTYTPVLSDEGKLVTLSNVSNIVVVLPPDVDLDFPVGGKIDFVSLDTGLATFEAGVGATAFGTPSLSARATYGPLSSIKIAPNSWLVIGDLA